MKHGSKVLLSLSAAAFLILMMAACATQPVTEVVMEEAPAVVEAAPAVEEAVAEEPVAAEEVPLVEEVVEEAVPAEEVVEAPAVEAPVEAAAEERVYRIIGTNGLLELALASYEGGMGLAEVSAIVNEAKDGYPTLVLDAGTKAVRIPNVQLGLEEGAILAEIVKEIGWFAMTPGAADLSFGTEALKMLETASGMTVLSANIEQDGELVFAPTTLLDVDGVKVGIFGLSSPMLNRMGVVVDVRQQALMAAAEAAVAGLEARGAEYIIALTHMGFDKAGFSEAELDWAAEYMAGHVDLIIDGMGSIPYEEIRGKTLYVQLGGGANVGGLEITVRGGKIVNVKTLLITEAMAAKLAPDAAVKALLASVW